MIALRRGALARGVPHGVRRRARPALLTLFGLAALQSCGVADRPTGPARLAVQPANAVANPGFESGAAGWLRVGASGRTLVGTKTHSGAYALQTVANNIYERAVFQDVAVAAGATYDAAAWVSTSGLDAAGATVLIQWLAAAGLPEVNMPAGTLLGAVTLGPLAGTQPWTRLARTVAAPNGTVVARVKLVVAAEPDNGGTAWFDDVELAAAVADATPPSVAIGAPAAHATVSGLVALAATASDDVGVAGVRFEVDGVRVGAEDTTAPYSVTWDASAAIGSRVITAIARDAAGNSAVSTPVPVTVAAPATRPNVVVVLTDDQRADHMGYLPLTTALLAGEAVRFEQAFATTPLCCPSRASLLTGLYAHNHGVMKNAAPNGGATSFRPASTIATWLQGAGYRTALVGKYLNEYELLAPAVPPGWSEFHALVLPNPMDYYGYSVNHNGAVVSYGSTAQDYSTTVLANRALQVIASTPAGQPLFLYFAPFAPHAPSRPEPSDVGRFAGLPPHRPPSYDEPDASDKPARFANAPRFTAAQMAASDALHQRMVESLQAVDRAVASIVGALQQSGRWSSTLFIFTSDNGLAWGEHRLLDTKPCLYEECARVPLWVRAPGIAARRDSTLVGLIDLGPTIAEWAGVAPATPVNGLSLVPLLRLPGLPLRSELLLEVPLTEGRPFGVRTARHVYVEYASGERELYDLVTDPFQLTNIVNVPANAALVAQLSAKLAALKGG